MSRIRHQPGGVWLFPSDARSAAHHPLAAALRVISSRVTGYRASLRRRPVAPALGALQAPISSAPDPYRTGESVRLQHGEHRRGGALAPSLVTVQPDRLQAPP